MAEGDINIYGAVRAQTGEGKAAYAAQVYDEAKGKFQSEINAQLDDAQFVTGEKVSEIGIDEEPTAGSKNLVESGGIFKSFINEYNAGFSDENVAEYIVDNGGAVIAILYKNGTIKFVADDIDTSKLKDLLGRISAQMNGAAIKYIVDDNNALLAQLNEDGTFDIFAGGGFAGEKTETVNINGNYVKIVCDKNGNIVATLSDDGKVTIPNLEIGNKKDVLIPYGIDSLMGLVASGAHNRNFVNDRAYNLIKANKGVVRKDGIIISPTPMMLIQDDDTYDRQIPVSYISTATDDTAPSSAMSESGGYASILFAIIKAFNEKYRLNLTSKPCVGLPTEGQAVGLTKRGDINDTFTGELNLDGKVVKRLVEKEGWYSMCHSMNARNSKNSFVVDGLDSTFADDVKANYVWAGNLHTNTTVVYDTVTKKNYQITQDGTGWTEIPYYYAQPYCAKSRGANPEYIINPSYSPKYQIDEWFKRAEKAGLPYEERAMVIWSGSGSYKLIREYMKYADVVFAGLHKINTIPLDSTIVRLYYNPSASANGITENTGYYNAYNDYDYTRLKTWVDKCISQKGLMVMTSHFHENYCANHYWDGYDFNYPIRTSPSADGRLDYYDANYPQEWIVPLTYQEIKDTIDGTHDYFSVPPARLGINSWADWYPCPGTTGALLWDIMKYAMDAGITFGSVSDAKNVFGNALTIGICNEQGVADNWFDGTNNLDDRDDETSSYCVVGADGSVRYSSK